MAFPTIPAPMYDYLAEYDQDRFVPGADAIPPNAITLLETNPGSSPRSWSVSTTR
ncbi:MAG: hypothetical protein R2705_07760 [Ilumatobacteraceae bacterium]